MDQCPKAQEYRPALHQRGTNHDFRPHPLGVHHNSPHPVFPRELLQPLSGPLQGTVSLCHSQNCPSPWLMDLPCSCVPPPAPSPAHLGLIHTEDVGCCGVTPTAQVLTLCLPPSLAAPSRPLSCPCASSLVLPWGQTCILPSSRLSLPWERSSCLQGF